MRVPLRPAVAGVGAGAVVMIATVAWSVTRVVGTGAMYRESRQHLEPAVRLGAEQLRGSRDVPLDSVANAVALATGYRVSVFDAQLVLMADSDLGPGHTDTIADPARRPEAAAALLRVDGFARRVSSLDGRAYLFSATRVYWRGESIVIRFGAPVAPIREAAARAAVWVALAVTVAGLVMLVFLHRFVGAGATSVDNTRLLLQRLGAGQFSGPRVKLSKIAELARLASAANRVRGEMEEQVNRVTRERDELAQLMDEVAEGLIALTDDARILRDQSRRDAVARTGGCAAVFADRGRGQGPGTPGRAGEFGGPTGGATGTHGGRPGTGGSYQAGHGGRVGGSSGGHDGDPPSRGGAFRFRGQCFTRIEDAVDRCPGCGGDRAGRGAARGAATTVPAFHREQHGPAAAARGRPSGSVAVRIRRLATRSTALQRRARCLVGVGGA